MAAGDHVPQKNGDGGIRNQYPASETLKALESGQVVRRDQDKVANAVENEQGE